ncbi:MAG: hypothetical protein K2Q18_07190 [Bdellovibrionales bacterium]|nr:hypothetical protein [Bdellovibrionales bacterium]
MIKFFYIWTLMSLTSFTAHASLSSIDLAHPFYLMPEGKFNIQTTAGYFMEEHEYERAKVVQDLFLYEHRFYKIATTVGLPHERQISIELETQEGGKLTKKYSPGIKLPSENVSYKGFHAIEITFQEHLKTNNEKDKLVFELKLKGSPFHGKETNNTYSGKDIAINLLYSHLHNEEWRLYGSIHSQIIGKKKTLKYNNNLEIVSPYSEFGSMIGLQWLNGKWWLDINSLFYLTTDYNSSSPSYTRLTDKGFVVGSRFLLGYYLSPSTIFTIEHTRQGSNFNMITESTSEGNEFEIEVQYTQLGVTWLF